MIRGRGLAHRISTHAPLVPPRAYARSHANVARGPPIALPPSRHMPPKRPPDRVPRRSMATEPPPDAPQGEPPPSDSPQPPPEPGAEEPRVVEGEGIQSQGESDFEDDLYNASNSEDAMFMEAQAQDDLDRMYIGLYRPPLILWDESRVMGWSPLFRSRLDLRWGAGQGTPLAPHPEDSALFQEIRSMKMPRLWTGDEGLRYKKRKRRRRAKHSRLTRALRWMQYYYIAENMKKFPLEPAFPDQIAEQDSISPHIGHEEVNIMRVQRDLSIFLGDIPTTLDRLSKNFFVEKARRFYMSVDDGGSSPLIYPPEPTPDEQAEKGYKGVPFLETKDLPITAFLPNEPNVFTQLQEQFNDAIYRSDWRPPASMAWDPKMNYTIPFWIEPRLRRAVGAARSYRWRHNPADEPAMRNLFYGGALLNSFDRAMAGSDRLDHAGNSRLDEPDRMLYGHRREMRKENAAMMRYQRTLLEDEYERKAEEMWSQGTIAADRGPIHYDRRPKRHKPYRFLTAYIIIFFVYLMWVTGSSSDKYYAEENWYQHPIVHDRARFHGFRVREMKVNGNGFWHALADQLYGTPEVWKWLKRQFFFVQDGQFYQQMATWPIGDPSEGTTLLDFFEKSRLPDVNWTKIWVRNLPGDFDQDYLNMEWTGRPGQTMAYYDMSPDLVDLRPELTREKRFQGKGGRVESNQEANHEEQLAYVAGADSDSHSSYYGGYMKSTHRLDHIDMFYVAALLNVRINILSTAYTIPHSKAWIHIDPPNHQVPQYEVNMLMHYINGEIVGFDSLVPYNEKEWHGLAKDPVKVALRKANEDRPGRRAAERASSFAAYVHNQMQEAELHEARLISGISLL